MTEYTNAEKADMILAHGATDCNGRATQRLYAEKHPVRRTPAHTMFVRLHQQLCGTGSFQKAARTELNEEIVLDMVETTPSLSTRASVLFTDEASFSKEGIFNTYNSHSWAAANPYVTRTRAAQDRFLVNIWAGILRDPRYLIFLEQVLPVIGQRTLPLRLVLPSGSSKMEPPHISEFLFGITWMQHRVNDGLAVEVQCIGLPDHQTFSVWIISSGGK
ncbi:DUF4817 domain-containing protein [Trichonephila clavipes]|uniref:DUF4817 domain-containing protein n=1 Tax=Trichonephila clavipes TaxID=2585209 RepID=A0A8X6SM70_TRICX|nr:DUF4817 domain-containing protein [Trichonephila clavipes]